MGRTQVGDEALRGRGDGALVGHHSLRGEVCQQIKDVDVVVSVLVCITDGEIPSPKVSEPCSNGPVTVGTSTVFEDRDVAGFASGLALVVGLEGVVFLIDDNVNCTVAGEFADFDKLDVRKLVPVGVAALVAGHPDVLTVVEVAQAVVVQDGHAVCSVRGNRHVVVTVAIEIADGDVHGVAVGGVGPCNGGTCGGCERGRGAEHHQDG